MKPFFIALLLFCLSIICNGQTSFSLRLSVVHNIGGGQVLADCLFAFKIIGHYQYEKKSMISAKNS